MYQPLVPPFIHLSTTAMSVKPLTQHALMQVHTATNRATHLWRITAQFCLLFLVNVTLILHIIKVTFDSGNHDSSTCENLGVIRSDKKLHPGMIRFSNPVAIVSNGVFNVTCL